jgi:hypothetical protein
MICRPPVASIETTGSYLLPQKHFSSCYHAMDDFFWLQVVMSQYIHILCMVFAFHVFNVENHVNVYDFDKALSPKACQF